jgi:hypothetical protein
MKCLFGFTMMVNPVSMVVTKSLVKENPVICMTTSEAGAIPLFRVRQIGKRVKSEFTGAGESVLFLGNLSGFGTQNGRGFGYCG